MIFITLMRLKEKPTKESVAGVSKALEEMAKEGLKVPTVYWTLGRYDSVWIYEAKDEKAAMKVLLTTENITETLVAVPRDEAIKLLE